MKSLFISLVLVAAAATTNLCAGERPDVLVVLTDQWNTRYTSWNNPQVQTPQIDAIAREGTVFDACYTTGPICMPARISLITGLYPHNHGHAVWGNPTNYHVRAADAPMFRDIRAAGYSTAQIGKLHWLTGGDWRSEHAKLEDYFEALGLDFVLNVSGPPDSAAGRDPYSESLMRAGLLEKVAKDLHARYTEDEYEARASVVPPDQYHDVFVTREAVKYIDAAPKEKPFCLVVSLHSPHPPLDPPGNYATMYDPAQLTLPENVAEYFNYDGRKIERPEIARMLAAYLGKVSLVDDCVGELVAAMQKRGTWRNALFILTADHGEMMGAHGALSKGRFWEESARVPLVIRWPDHVQPGRTDALAQLFDVYPTIVEAIGGTLSPGRFAKSLLPVATGKTASVHDAVISEVGSEPPLGLMLRTGTAKWFVDRRSEYLFDLSSDPLELQNLAGTPEAKEKLTTMRSQMLEFLRSTQVNLASGSKSKVKRLREAAEAGKAEK